MGLVCISNSALTRGRALDWADVAGTGRTMKELPPRRKEDKVKATMAMQLRIDTMMTWVWITQRLGTGHWRTAADAVRANPKGDAMANIPR
jgi:hypothetical protein